MAEHWESNAVEHTFSSGRTMLVRRTLSMTWLMLHGVEEGDFELAAGMSAQMDGTLTDPSIAAAVRDPSLTEEERAEAQSIRVAQLQMVVKVQRAVVESMFIHPRVYWDPADMPEVPPPANGDVPAHMLALDLRDEEMAEVLEIAFKGVDGVGRFRGDDDGKDGGKGGEGVGKPAKRASGARARKR